MTDKNLPETLLTHSRTMAFVALAVSQLFYSLSMRHFEKSIFQVGLFSNPLLIGSIALGILLQVGVISIPFLADAFKVSPLALQDWGRVLLIALIPMALSEIVKGFRRALKNI
jgi:Ca2+-transporting ATPase